MQSVGGSFEQSNDVLSIEKWGVPPAGWYKLNVDAAVDKENGKVGYGAVIRNSSGQVMAVGVDQGVFSDDVDIAEAEALPFGIRLASETSLSPLMVESDSLRVIQFISGKCHTRTELFWIISEIQMLILEWENFQLRHIRRCNHVANVLAKYALHCSKSSIWLEDYPIFLGCYL